MIKNKLISADFAARINMNQEQIAEALEKIAGTFSLGTAVLAQGIEIGYEDVNILLVTEKRKYLVKMLGSDKTYSQCQAYWQTMCAFQDGGIPTPRLFQTKAGAYMLQISSPQGVPIQILVMEFFEGKDFLEAAPSDQDISTLLTYIAKIHSLSYRAPELPESYDPWEPQFLLSEYKKHGHLLNSSERDLVEKILPAAERLNLSSFKKATIHADLMRNNCLKNAEGQYCLLDFGVVSWNYIVIDVAIFIAGFCFDPINTDVITNRRTYNFVLAIYKNLEEYEPAVEQILPTLITMTYAAYLIAALAERANGNTTSENDYWITMGRQGLTLCRQLAASR
jgi:Ser/Thr protein kinase RdoA (MazF antagonist)